MPGNAGPSCLQHIGKICRCEMTALIGVEDLWAAEPGQSFVQRPEAERRLHGVGHPKGQQWMARRWPMQPTHPIMRVGPNTCINADSAFLAQSRFQRVCYGPRANDQTAALPGKSGSLGATARGL